MSLSFGFAFLLGAFTLCAGWLLGCVTKEGVNEKTLRAEFARGYDEGQAAHPTRSIQMTDFRRVK